MSKLSYQLVKLGERCLKVLPFSWVIFLFQVGGLFLFYIDRRKREVGFRNIKLAFPHKSYKEIVSILRKSFLNFGMNIGEILFYSPRAEKVVFEEEDFLSKENGIIVGIHEGNWEVCDFFLAQRCKYAVLAKRQKEKGLDRFLNEVRKRNNLGVCFSLKETIRYLKKGYWIGMVVDHGAEENAPFIEFFGNLVPTPSGSVYLAKKFNRKIYPLFNYRKDKQYHIIKKGGCLDCKDREVSDVLREINTIYQGFLKEHPQEYMWWFKRFKRKKNLQILVLNDGRTGHLKQSQTFVSLLSRKTDYKIEIKKLDVEYKSRGRRLLLEAFALFSGKRCLGCGKCLQMCLSAESFRSLEREFADIVVSTGSKLAPVNRIFSFCIGAKSVVILKPNIPLYKFDLAIVPYHDRSKGKNVVNIKGALSFPSHCEEEGEECRRFFNLSRERKVAFFLGGVLGKKDEFFSNIEIFIKKLKNFVKEKGYRVLITTSARTPSWLEEVVEKAFRKFALTEALVIANKKNYSFVAPGFLWLSDIIFVSSDSVSMISESLSINKTTVCVFLEEIVNKHHRFFLSSLENGLINFLRYPYDFFSFRPPQENISEENKRVVTNAIARLLL